VTQGGIELDKIAKPNGEATPADAPPAGIDALVALLRLTLKDAVKDVRLSTRLTDSAVCLVAEEGDLDINLARLLKQHQRMDAEVKRVLEINAGHPLIGALAARLSTGGNSERLADAAWLLLDQARILQGEALEDPVAFARRQSSIMQAALGG
jgi:molecular chaperone HtpG